MTGKPLTILKKAAALILVLAGFTGFSQSNNPAEVIHYGTDASKPSVYVKSAYVEDGTMFLDLYNSAKANTFYIYGKSLDKSTKSSTYFKYLIVLDSNNLNRLVIPADNIYSIECTITNGTTSNKDYIYYTSKSLATDTDVFSAEDAEIANYPNPFSNTTNFTFTMKKGADVNIEIYDLAGKKVSTVAEGFYAAGSSSIRFDSSEMPSGVYVCRMKAGEGTFTKKIVKR
jgi:hypothetical protein